MGIYKLLSYLFGHKVEVVQPQHEELVVADGQPMIELPQDHWGQPMTWMPQGHWFVIDDPDKPMVRITEADTERGCHRRALAVSRMYPNVEVCCFHGQVCLCIYKAGKIKCEPR
jgi:hypothetical protein